MKYNPTKRTFTNATTKMINVRASAEDSPWSEPSQYDSSVAMISPTQTIRGAFGKLRGATSS
jgi:hypothetical protein